MVLTVLIANKLRDEKPKSDSDNLTINVKG